MIFASLAYPEHYSEAHSRISEVLSSCFENVASGLQGDSWFWIYLGEHRVAVDTFTAQKHEVKCPVGGLHVEQVLSALSKQFEVIRRGSPEFEAHEEGP